MIPDGTVLLMPPLEGYSESRTFPVEITRATDGTEHRNLLLGSGVTPNRMVRFPYAASDEQEVAAIEHFTTAAQDGLIYVPLWLSKTPLTDDTDGTTRIDCATTGLEFAIGDSLVIINAALNAFTSSVITDVQATYIDVEDVISGFVIGDLVLPIIPVTVTGNPDYDLQIDFASKGSLTLEEVQ